MKCFIGRRTMPALFCALIFLICEALSFPFAEMGICDDWSYVHSAHVLAQTGQVHYNGWAATMLGWQLYGGAALLKIFGFSFTVARLFIVLVAALTTFLMQRCLVRAGVGERNATIGTLAIVLTPLYMQLSAIFMTDVPGLFAVVVCFYGCLRAIQSEDTIKANLWLCFAAFTNVVFGTCRQIAWLGVLVMVPCTLWIVYKQRKTVLAGCIATFAGWVSVFLCMHWFAQQPYAISEHIFFEIGGVRHLAFTVKSLLGGVFEIFFFILPVTVAFLILLLEGGRRFWRDAAAFSAVYVAVMIALAFMCGKDLMLEPRLGDWVGNRGGYGIELLGVPTPLVLNMPVRLLLTAISVGSTLSAFVFLWRIRERILEKEVIEGRRTVRSGISWKQLLFLTGPFSAAYFALLIPRSSVHIMDRYLLVFMFVFAMLLIRAFQDFVRPSLPAMTTALVVLMAIFGIAITHDMFAFYRARAAATVEVLAAGVALNMVDGGFELNHWAEISDGGHINDRKITNPANSYIEMGRYKGWTCKGDGIPAPHAEETPRFSPRYGLSFNPNSCAGEGPFAPVSYFRWLGFARTWIYVVKYQPSRVALLLPGEHAPSGY